MSLRRVAAAAAAVRVRVRVGVGVGVVVLAGLVPAATPMSQSASAADDAATVNGESISVDVLDDTIESLAEFPELTNFTIDELSGTVSAEQARIALRLLVVNEAQRQFLGDHGAEPTDADREGALDELAEDDPTRQFSGAARDAIIDRIINLSKIDEVEAPAIDDLRAQYEAAPASLGVICARQILVDDNTAGEAAVAALEAGESFDDVGAEYSTDPDFATNQGLVSTDPEQPCIALSQIRTADQALTAAFFDAEPGQPVGPVTSQFGLHVLVVTPFDDVRDSLAQFFETTAESVTEAAAAGSQPPPTVGQVLFDGYMSTTEVSVNPRYGRWEPVTGAVVPLGQE